MWKDNIYFILVEPNEPGNIGSAARAIKNMGFSNLEMVRPVDYHTDETRWLAANSYDVIENATIYETLSAALKGKSFAVGLTRRIGKTRGLIMPIKKSTEEMLQSAEENRIAVVFGREDKGLTNEEIKQCSYIATIPSHENQPSLNLAQAVLIVAYELSQLEPQDNLNRLVDREELMPLFDRISDSLKLLGYIPRGDRDMESRILRNVKNIIGRSGLTDWELKMIHGIITQLEDSINKP
jgi:TrmH family RNA methyltransferase